MMSWRSLSRLLSGIKGAYNDINPSTLTGAIDVIVVEQPDGSFKCGPFHVRFGKLTAISPADKVVELYVNGRYVDFLRMRLGGAGDAYFVDGPPDTFSSDDEKYSASDPETRGNHNIQWPGMVTRRRRKKVRRDSAMSEPDTSTVLDDLEDDIEPQSDCEPVDLRGDDCSRLANRCGSDSFLSESFKPTGQDLDWAWGGFPYRHSECRPPNLNKCNSVPIATETTEHTEIKENADEKTKQLSPAKNVEVYLEDLFTSEVDQTVKETYIYPPTHPSSPSVSHITSYLPHATAEINCVDAGYKSDYEHSPRSLSPIYPTVFGLKLSLCGCPSVDSQVSEDKFLENLISFEEFIQDPESILSNPNLTVQLNGKYLSWPVAAPSIVSILAFQTELPHRTVRQLENVHMSKKQSRRTSWFSWGSRKADAEEQDDAKVIESAVLPKVSEEPVTVPQTAETAHVESQVVAQKTKKRNRLSSTDISRLNLLPGRNDVEFRVTTKYQGTCICSASIFLWHWSDRIVISDVDGTITRSDLLGHLLPMLGHDWTHDGVAGLYDRVARNGYRFLYLSARALGQAGITRGYLRQVVQKDLRLPDGPILLSPNSLLHAFHQEVIEKKPENFKIRCLSDVRELFPKDSNPLYAGFGNKINDVYAYEQAGIERCRIFTINPRGELRNQFHFLKSTSYKELNDSVDLYFPFITRDSTVFERSATDSDGDPNDPSEHPVPCNNVFRRSSVGAPSVDMSMYSCFTYWRQNDFTDLFVHPEES